MDYRKPFVAWDTSLLITKVKPCFEKSALPDKASFSYQEWRCKRCGSIFLFDWADFSVAVEQEYLKLTHRNTSVLGKPTHLPIPLYAGLFGYSYPKREEISL